MVDLQPLSPPTEDKRIEMDSDAEATQLRLLTDRLSAEINSLQKEKEKLVAQRKAQELANTDLIVQLSAIQEKHDRVENQRNRMQEDMEMFEGKFLAEARDKDELAKANKKLEGQLRTTRDQLALLQQEKHAAELDSRRKEEEIGHLKNRAANDANLVATLKANTRKLIDRIQELEEELNSEKKLRYKADRQRQEMQSELEAIQSQMEEANGHLTAQMHINKIHAEELSNLQREIQLKSKSRGLYIADMCSMQCVTVNNLRSLCKQAAHLESEANQVLLARQSILNNGKFSCVYLNSNESEEESSI